MIWTKRILVGLAGGLAAITAMGHFPGWVPSTETDPGYWQPLGDSLYQWIGVAAVLLTSGSGFGAPKKGRLP